MGVDFRRWAKWAAATSFVLLLMFLASFGPAMDKMLPLLDPEQENVAKLEEGGSISVELTDTRYYVILRVVEDGVNPAPEVRLVDSDGEEIQGSAPTSLHVDRELDAGGPKYRPVLVYYPKNTANYTIHNDGDNTLWLVDDAAAESEMLRNPIVLFMGSTCCFGFIIGLLAIIFAIISTRQKPRNKEKVVSGLVIDGRVMTTDELYRIQKGEEVSASSFAQEKVADPFVSSDTVPAKQKIIQQDLDSGINEAEWKEWDQG
ncbi:MAG: hypothetical protein CND29_03145 [Marine Group II euryarchaeote MED-G36]|nr:MAG: hypothetical protein CND29_03145 [Marine Group II euryarchaeote MED-G36]